MKFNLVAVSLLSTYFHATAQEVVDQGECINPNAASGTCDSNSDTNANANSNANATTSTTLPQEQDKNASYSDIDRDTSHLVDDNAHCKYWAESGECDVNPRFMRRSCVKSCTEHDIRIGRVTTTDINTTKKSDQCQLYMALSSIPNSGLGMYTASPISSGEVVYHPDIIVNYFDFAFHSEAASNKARESSPEYIKAIAGKKDRNRSCALWAREGECDSNPQYMKSSCAKSCALADSKLLENDDEVFFLPDDYYWDAGNTKSKYEADEVSSLVPGLGALANSHTGLVNCDMDHPKIDSLGYHRSTDPGVGAFSDHHSLGFVANKDIKAGMELFVEYGDEWFSGREYKFGPLPLSNHFEEADDIVERFWKTAKEEDPFAESLYNFTLDLVTDVKLKMAMPKTIEYAKEARQDGTAILTVPEAVKTDEWLKENGTCLDNIRADQSTIDQAGRGAFATRKLKKGTSIAPLPMIHMDRHKLQMFGEGDSQPFHQQMVLNYSYGHQDSSLLLFPYSPVVNFINNNLDKEKVNADLRWSKGFGKNWENKTTAEIFETEKYAGLVLEIFATKDIEEDEEIFIDYGQAWDDAWQKHVNDWKPTPDSHEFIPVHRLNVPGNEDIRTEAEQRKNPYPPNVDIICHLRKNIFEEEAHTKGEIPYERYMTDNGNQNDSEKCKIVRRSSTEGGIKYLVAITRNQGGKTIQVNGMPRHAIELVNRPYASDQHIENSFRHEIQIPDSIFPQKWRDLKEGSRNENEGPEE